MKIKPNTILTLDQYINEALYNKKMGYYMKTNPFKSNGDYITSPNISILFSEMIAIWVISFWQNLKSPKSFNLIELGAGNGEMMKQILSTFNNFPKFKKYCKIYILEKSSYLKKIQKKNLKYQNVYWLKNINEVANLPSIFIANEFFDALPIKQFIKIKKNWYERKVQFKKKNNPKFINVLTDIKSLDKKIGFKISHNQKFIEYSPLTNTYLKTISKKIKQNSGGILIIDYGYLDKNMKDTLQSISKHKYNSVLNKFGRSDITYGINFNLMERIMKKFQLKVSGITSQKKFLLNLGILKRAEIISKNLPFSKKADIYFRIKRLIDENSMGRLFKVMFATRKSIKFQIGFKN